MKKKIAGLLCFAFLVLISCERELVETPIHEWKLLVSNEYYIEECYVDEDNLWFTTIKGLYRLNKDGVISDSVLISFPDWPNAYDNRVRPRIYNGDFVLPTIEFNGTRHIKPEDRVLWYGNFSDRLIYPIKDVDFYHVGTEMGILAPSDNTSLVNTGKRGLLFIPFLGTAPKIKLFEYSVSSDPNGNSQLSISNTIELPENISTDGFMAFRDDYILTGNSGTYLVSSTGSYKKVLENSFDDLISVNDTIFGFHQVKFFYSKDGEAWNEGDSWGQQIIGTLHSVRDKLILLGASGPHVLDLKNKKYIPIDLTGIALTDGSLPLITAIKEFNGNVFLFTSNGIYIKRADYLF